MWNKIKEKKSEKVEHDSKDSEKNKVAYVINFDRTLFILWFNFKYIIK